MKSLIPFRNAEKAVLTVLIVFYFLLFMPETGRSQSQTFITSGTWNCPAYVTSVSVQCWGGGGAGGSARAGATLSSAYGGGGAGGAYAIKTIVVVPATPYTVTVGPQVTGTSSTIDNTVVNGNPSWFAAPGTVFAQGGAGGVSRYTSSNLVSITGAGGTGSSATSIGTTVFKGGNGASGTGLVGGGGGGSSAGSAANGNSGATIFGGAAPAGGAAGGGGATGNAGGSAGNAPGGGGGGAAATGTTQKIGGTGAAGQVILTYAPNLAATAITAFANTCVNTSSAPNTFTVSGFNLSTTVSLTAPAGFTISTASGGPYSSSLTLTPVAGSISQIIYVQFTPITATLYSGNIVITSSATTVNDAVSGTGLAGPGVVTVTPPSPVTDCYGAINSLTATASGGLSTLFTEGFNAVSLPVGWSSSVAGSVGGTPANAAWTLRPNSYVYNTLIGSILGINFYDNFTFNSNDNTQFILSNSSAQKGTQTRTSLAYGPINATTYQTLTLNYYNNFTPRTAGDAAIVEVSTNGGLSYTAVQTFTKQLGTLAGPVYTFPGGNVYINYGVKLDQLTSIDLSAYRTQPALFIRFRYTANNGWWWAIDNVSLTGTTTAASFTWSPTTDLYTDAAATINYTSTPQNTVYQKMTGAQTYNVTAMNASGCTSTGTTSVALSPNPVWTGNISSLWNTAGNWCNNTIPTAATDVIIPGTGIVNFPKLTAAGFAHNINIAPGATVDLNGSTLTVNGAFSGGGTLTGSNTSGLIISGTVNAGTVYFTSGALPAASTNNYLQVFSIQNSGSTITLGDSLNITAGTAPGTAGTVIVNGTLNTGGYLTLKSNNNGTAAAGMSSGAINGNVIVERFIATGINHAKTWQLLATPTQGQTIKDSWQESATAVAGPGPYPNGGNLQPGFGIMLTSDVAGAAGQPTPGFDAYTTPGPSIKVYNSALDNYIGPSNTNLTPIYNPKGYFVLVRGDRSVYTSAMPANPAILRTTGTLFTQFNPPPSTTVAAGKFESVGNPYASEIDLTKLGLPDSIKNFITLWDPTIGGVNSAYGLGAFQTLFLSGTDYVNLLTSTAYGSAGTINNFIESGQAFLIEGAPGGGGTIAFTEGAKASGSNPLVLRHQSTQAAKIAQLRTTLYTANADGSAGEALDGVLNRFNYASGEGVHLPDARKFLNSGENLSIKTANALLCIENKNALPANDTVFLNLTGERVQQYQLNFDAQNISTVVEAFVEDTYLKTRTPLDLDGKTVVNFLVSTVAGSYAPDRFRIVFSPLEELPVTLAVEAYRQNKNINIEWKTSNEHNINEYVVEKSVNGTDFTTLAVKIPTGNNESFAGYTISDITPVTGYNYYRIKSIDIKGAYSYSNTVKVLFNNGKPGISVYPNPVTDGQIHLQFSNEPAGKYGIRLLNKAGQLMAEKQITHEEGNNTELIRGNFNLSHGMYLLEITSPDGSVKDINVMY